ncbi:DUF881 domain-containing protein [Halobacillus shinanisalinarum]|uniref:DUF881 domain-containing protein n=1 Tax=Halobacillus shinanisalinarum TaxID=2932258 RepID=A0ABY4GY13_9BACI|nr:DUF881 domain-containing protein [Halobacillus shinanisalinarum]UOQ93086.1 DUF881 domain-containing protein [Halobacillus shinanisalinarum]
MSKRTTWIISFIFLVIGFMIAIQFQTTNAGPAKDRETRDEWEIREAIESQQGQQQEFLTKVSKADQTIENYQQQSKQQKIETLKASISSLERKAGLTEQTGAGIMIEVVPIFVESDEVQTYPSISPQLLSRLINDLNEFGADEIAIGSERVTNLSPVRGVNGYTYVNNRPLPPLPVKITALADNPKKLSDYIEVSQSNDYFAIENLDLRIEIRQDITLPKFEDPLHLEVLQEAEMEKTDE